MGDIKGLIGSINTITESIFNLESLIFRQLNNADNGDEFNEISIQSNINHLKFLKTRLSELDNELENHPTKIKILNLRKQFTNIRN